MNKTVEIIRNLCKYENKDESLNEVFKKIFEEKNQIELLKKRALIIEECERVLRVIEADEDSLIDIYEVLSFPNLNLRLRDVKPILATKDANHASTVFAFFENIERPHDVEDIVKFSDELRDEAENDTEVTDEQRVIIFGICDAVDAAKKEHSITGNNAIKKLYEILIGKIYLYKIELSSIKSKEIQYKLEKVYKKVEELNKVMGFLLSIKNNVSEFIGFFS